MGDKNGGDYYRARDSIPLGGKSSCLVESVATVYLYILDLYICPVVNHWLNEDENESFTPRAAKPPSHRQVELKQDRKCWAAKGEAAKLKTIYSR